MRKMWLVATSVLAAAFLAGCAQAAPEPAANVEPEAAATDLNAAQLDYCEAWWDVDADYSDFLTEIMNAGETFDGSAWPAIDKRLNALDASALSPSWQADNRDYLSMQAQINDAIAGDGNASLVSTRWKLGVVGIMERCVDAGFTAPE